MEQRGSLKENLFIHIFSQMFGCSFIDVTEQAEFVNNKLERNGVSGENFANRVGGNGDSAGEDNITLTTGRCGAVPKNIC